MNFRLHFETKYIVLEPITFMEISRPFKVLSVCFSFVFVCSVFVLFCFVLFFFIERVPFPRGILYSSQICLPQQMVAIDIVSEL